MCIFNTPILITLYNSDPFISLQTLSPEYGHSQRFFITKQTMLKQLDDGAEGSIIESDLLNYCSVSHAGNSILFKVSWLQGNFADELHGYRQTFTIPADKVIKALAGETVKHLSYSPACKDKADIFITRTAHEAIAAQDKLKRHALRRFFRDHFDYGRDEKLVIQRDEFVNGFYFFSATSRYNGGIVLHGDEVIGKDGRPHHRVYYGLHT